MDYEDCLAVLGIEQIHLRQIHILHISSSNFKTQLDQINIKI